MKNTIIVGEFEREAFGFDWFEKQIEKDWKTMRLKSQKYSTSNFREGDVFCFSFPSEKHSNNWLEKMQSLANDHSIETNFEYHVMVDIQAPNLEDIVKDYYIQTTEEL